MTGSETAAPPVFIWVRTTIDWADEATILAQLKPEFLPKLERWNGMFSIPYHRFRHEVCEIARLNLSRVAGAPVRPWDEIPDGAVVLPVDDDDWFAPDIVERLRPLLDPDAIGYLWTPRFLEVPVGIRHRYELRQQRLHGAPLRYLCATNGYAIVKEPGTEEVARNHVAASRLFEAERARVPVAGGRPSVTNRTLASQTTLFHMKASISHARLLLKYRAYRRLYRTADLDAVEWAAEYVERMAALMEQMGLRLGRRHGRD